MSKADVEAVFGPQWIQDSLSFHRERLRQAELHILELRHMLRAYDPALPDPYDGEGWHAATEEVGHAHSLRR